MWRLLLLAILASADDNTEMDGEASRKILGSSVVTSVSVIMDTGNGSRIYADAAGNPVSKPVTASDVASPIDLLSPDRYEFYTFDNDGELVRRLMTLDEIQEIIATGDDDGFDVDSLSSNGFLPEKRVNDVVNNVQNVLKEEMKIHKDPTGQSQLDTPDVSDSWSMILPAIFGNSGEDIKPEPPAVHVTPDTIMIEPTVTPVSTTEKQISTTEKVMTLQLNKTTTKTTTTTTEKPPKINVEIITNSNSTSEKFTSNKEPDNSLVVEIKPIQNDQELTKENIKPIYHVFDKKTTKKPIQIKPTTFRPSKLPSVVTSTTESTNISTVAPSSTQAVKITSPITVNDAAPEESVTLSEKVAPPQASTSAISTQESTTSKIQTTTRISTPTATTTEQVASTESTTETQPTTTSQPETTYQEIISDGTITSTITTQTETTSTDITTEETRPLTELPSAATENITKTTEPLPTLIELLNNYQFLHSEISTERQVTETTTAPPETSSFAPLSTFFIVDDNKFKPEYVKDQPVQSNVVSSMPSTSEALTTTGGTTLEYSSSNDDLSTLSTEYITQKSEVTNQPSTKTQTPEKTTQGNLDQFLLTSTNIYEINSELANIAEQTTTVDDFTESTTSDGIQTTTVVSQDDEVTNTTVSLSTDKTIIESIEQLISQAVGTVAPPVDNEKEGTKIQELMLSNTNKTMPEVLEQTATVASNLLEIEYGETPTTTEQTTESDILNSTDILSESVESLLSQVYGLGSTTLTFDSMITTTSPPVTTVESSTEKSTQQPEDFSPHIINITIIRNTNKRNQTKPAKADLSLEMEYEDMLNELKKNSSLLSSNLTYIQTVQQEILNADASSSIHEGNYEKVTTESNFDEETTTVGFDTTTADITTTEEIPSTTVLTPTKLSLNISQEIQVDEPKPTIAENVSSINENEDSSWTLVSTLNPHADTKPEITTETASTHPISIIVEPPPPIDLVPKPLQGYGLEDSTSKLDSDVYQFVQLCNELAFGFWKSVTGGLSSARSVVVSPFAATSLLAMVFLGARGATSGEMNEILKLDDMVTFNPHLIFKNVSESIDVNPDSGVAVSTIIRELYSDRSKGNLLGFYKERVRQFYDGHVEEASFREIGDVIRRRTNLLVKKNTNGKITEYLKDGSISPKPPLAGISVSIFETDCSHSSTEGRDGEIHFVVSPSIRERRLIPIPATVYRSGFLAGYEPSLDATAAALGTKDHTVSTIFIIPGQQGLTPPGDGLVRLEKRLVESSFRKGAWGRLLRSLIPRPGLELQIPRFFHRSVINATQSLKKMGLHDLFDSRKADLKGLNGAAHELHLSDVIQVNEFATCGEDRIGEAHHREIYPDTTDRRSRLLEEDWPEPRDYQRAFHDPLHDPSYLTLPLSSRPRQARVPETPRLRFDRPFLYFIRHNPSGLILHMGRFHPRLLP